MKSVPHYKLWIYSVNGAVIALQLCFLVGVALVAVQPMLLLFQLHALDACLVATYILICLQFSISGLGIWAVWKSKKRWVRHYWLGSMPLIAADMVLAVMWAYRFRSLHRDFLKLEAFDDGMQEISLIRLRNSSTLIGNECATWEEVKVSYGCILPASIRIQCAGLIEIEMVESGVKCTILLLRWLHSWSDVLAFLLYFLVYPLKLVVAIVLRDDIIELSSEIDYTGNRQRYRHWASADSEDEEMSDRYSCASVFSPRTSRGDDEAERNTTRGVLSQLLKIK